MPSNTAEQVAALRKRRAQATNVDGVNVDFALLDALLEAWDNWQMVEAMPAQSALRRHGDWWDLLTDVREKRYDWQECSMRLDGTTCTTDELSAADALAAAFKEGTDAD